jgi:sulfide:quinone oxidoreductase
VAVEKSRRRQADVVPQGVSWVRDAAVEIDPHARIVVTAMGGRLDNDVLVLCPGPELALDVVPGLSEAFCGPNATTNYTAELAVKTAELVRRLRGGRAVFCAPGSPIKCPGAPQKAAYLACGHWQRRGGCSATSR